MRRRAWTFALAPFLLLLHATPGAAQVSSVSISPVRAGDCIVRVRVVDGGASGRVFVTIDDNVVASRQHLAGTNEETLALPTPAELDSDLEAVWEASDFSQHGVARQHISDKASTQDPSCRPNVREVLPFLDSTFVGFARSHSIGATPSTPETTFEADIVPNFVVYESVFKELRKAMKSSRGWHLSHSLTAVPMVKLRMFVNEPSAPVRTPSYMPKGTFQTLLFRAGKAHDIIDLYSLQATVGHHSNGQDGCLYTTERPLPNGDCALPVGGITPDTPVNKVNGSFSTNYLQFGFRYRFIHLRPETTPGVREGDRDLTIGTDLELNPGNGAFLGGGGIDPDQKALYGPTRVSAVFGGALSDIWACERLEGKGLVKYIHGQLATGVPSIAGGVEGTCLFSDGWGISARLYRGQDYYNLGYADRVTRFQIGFTYSHEGFLKFDLNHKAKTTRIQ